MYDETKDDGSEDFNDSYVPSAPSRGNTESRVDIWDPFTKTRITGVHAPKKNQLVTYLKQNDGFVIYDGQDKSGAGALVTTSSGNSKKRRPTSEMEEADIWCCVCYSDEGYADDPIVVCEGCECGVHKYCYGILEIPEGDIPWYCRVCEKKLNPQEIRCALCPNVGGAYKPTDDGRWVHVVCTLWIPEIRFLDIDAMEPVTGVEEIEARTKWNVKCSICTHAFGPVIKVSISSFFFILSRLTYIDYTRNPFDAVFLRCLQQVVPSLVWKEKQESNVDDG